MAELDRISVLPRNILEIVLCFLPVRDAVRTSILSKSWKHCWKTIPKLVFNEDILSLRFRFPRLMGGKQFSDCHREELQAVKYVSVINKVLLLHNGPVLKFSLSFPLSYDAQIIHDFLDQWIPLLSRKGIKQFTLYGHLSRKFTAYNFCSLDLTHLRLENSWFSYIPAFGGLTYLMIIELIDVTGTEQSIFDCPVLEKLALIRGRGFSHTNFRAPNLKCLHQHYQKRILEYSFAGLENLTEYSLRLSGAPITQPETPIVVDILGTLHKIEKFSVAEDSIKYLAAGGSPPRLPELLPYLRTLSIFHIDFTCFSEVSCLLCLVRSAPNLCKLHISVRHMHFKYSVFLSLLFDNPRIYYLHQVDLNGMKENLKDYWEEDIEDCTAYHLEIVTFSHFQGHKAELELVKFLLACSPLLQTMFIHHNCNMKKDLEVNILEKMLEFSRASSRAQIRSLKCPFDAVDYGPWVNNFR